MRRVMLPMPPADLIARFVGDAIAQVWLDPFSVQLIFDGGVRIEVKEHLEHVEPDGTAWSYFCRAAGGGPVVLQRLLYKKIVAAERDELRITFRMEDGASLSIFSELGPYESGVIWDHAAKDWIEF